MIETIIGWGFLLVLFITTFKLLNRLQRRRSPIKALSVLLHANGVGISLSLNVLLAALLYEPVIYWFGIRMDGFINLNGVATIAIIWLIISVLMLVAVIRFRAVWGVYYRTLRATQVVFLLVPLVVVLVFLFAAALK